MSSLVMKMQAQLDYTVMTVAEQAFEPMPGAVPRRLPRETRLVSTGNISGPKDFLPSNHSLAGLPAGELSDMWTAEWAALSQGSCPALSPPLTLRDEKELTLWGEGGWWR
jgi:hypothetical protein